MKYRCNIDEISFNSSFNGLNSAMNYTVKLTKMINFQSLCLCIFSFSIKNDPT